MPEILKPGDYIIEGQGGQLFKLSISDETNGNYIDLSVGRNNENKNVRPSKARIYISDLDIVDSKFQLDGKGKNKKRGSCIYIQGDNIRIVGNSKKQEIEQAVLGNQLFEILDELLDTIILHKHPMEVNSIESIPKWKVLKKKLKNILSNNISIN